MKIFASSWTPKAECARKLFERAAGVKSVSGILFLEGLKDYQIRYIADIEKSATWDDVVAGKRISLSFYILPLKLVKQRQSGEMLRYQLIPQLM